MDITINLSPTVMKFALAVLVSVWAINLMREWWNNGQDCNASEERG